VEEGSLSSAPGTAPTSTWAELFAQLRLHQEDYRGLEYYADYPSITNIASRHNQQQQFFLAIDLNVSGLRAVVFAANFRSGVRNLMPCDSRTTQEGCLTIVCLSHSEQELANSVMPCGLSRTVVEKVHNWTGHDEYTSLCRTNSYGCSEPGSPKGESTRRG
jgi:hypothetical protein